MIPCALLKANARENLRGRWGVAILVLLLAYVLLGAASVIVAVGSLVLIGLLYTGVALVFLKLSYREEVAVGDLFRPFQNFVNTFFGGFLTAIFTFLWSLLFVIPGIIKAIAYSQVYYIMCDHPEYTGREAIQASREMMQGHKGEYFLLQLSFIGWFLLSSLTFGLLLFYVVPYYQSTMAEYYRYLKESLGAMGDSDWGTQEPQPLEQSPLVNQRRSVEYDPEQFD